MNFIYPEFLWAFAVLIIPIIIHLFNFKRYKTLRFSSLAFIKFIDQKTKSIKTLKHYLILASRLLAFSFLVLAFAQPYFSSENEDIKSLDNIIIIYLDNSFSMQAQGPEGELLSEARENVREIIQKSEPDTRFIIFSNHFSGIEERILSKNEAYERLDKIKYSSLSKKMSEIIRWIQEVILKQQLTKTNIQVLLFSDFQKTDETINQIKWQTQNIYFYPIQLKPENNRNVYVDSIWFDSPIHKKNTLNTLNIQVKNHSTENVDNIELLVQLNGKQKTLFVSIPANGKHITPISFTPTVAGYHKIKITAIEDGLQFDNQFFLTNYVRSSSNILLLNGEDAVSNVGLVLSLEKFYNVTSKSVFSVTKEDFNQKDLVIINGVNQLSSGLSSYLSEHIQNGGSVALFPGTSPDLSGWNHFLRSQQLPAIGPVTQSGTKIKRIHYEPVFYKEIFERKPKNINLSNLSKVFQGKVFSDDNFITLLELQNGLPLFIHKEDKGNIFMFYSSLSPEFGSFTASSIFPATILRIAELSLKKLPEYLIIGKESLLPVIQHKNSEKIIKLKQDNFEFIPQTMEVGGITYLVFKSQMDNNRLKDGFYTIFAEEQELGEISLNYAREESKLTYFNENEILTLFSKLGFKNISFQEISSKTQLISTELYQPNSYWNICIALSIVFFLIEMGIILLYKPHKSSIV